jgi:hypothetical protein
MTSLEMTLLGMGTVALVAAYSLNKIDPNKWGKHTHD